MPNNPLIMRGCNGRAKYLINWCVVNMPKIVWRAITNPFLNPVLARRKGFRKHPATRCSRRRVPFLRESVTTAATRRGRAVADG